MAHNGSKKNSKWIRIAPNDSKLLQMAPNGLKWLQKAQHVSQWQEPQLRQVTGTKESNP